MAKLYFSRQFIQSLIDVEGKLILSEQLPYGTKPGTGVATQIGEQFGTVQWTPYEDESSTEEGGDGWLELDLPSWPYESTSFIVTRVL